MLEDTHNYVQQPIAYYNGRLIHEGHEMDPEVQLLDEGALGFISKDYSVRIKKITKAYDESMHDIETTMDVWQKRLRYSATMAGAMAETALFEQMLSATDLDEDGLTHRGPEDMDHMLAQDYPYQDRITRNNELHQLEKKWFRHPLWDCFCQAQYLPNRKEWKPHAINWPEESFDSCQSKFNGQLLHAREGVELIHQPIPRDRAEAVKFIIDVEESAKAAVNARDNLRKMEEMLRRLNDANANALNKHEVTNIRGKMKEDSDFGKDASPRSALHLSQLFAEQAIQHVQAIRDEVEVELKEVAEQHERVKQYRANHPYDFEESYGGKHQPVHRTADMVPLVFDMMHARYLEPEEADFINDEDSLATESNAALSDHYTTVMGRDMEGLTELLDYSTRVATLLMAYAIANELPDSEHKVRPDLHAVLEARCALEENASLELAVEELPGLDDVFAVLKPFAWAYAGGQQQPEDSATNLIRVMHESYDAIEGALSQTHGIMSEASDAEQSMLEKRKPLEKDFIKNIVSEGRKVRRGQEHVERLDQLQFERNQASNKLDDYFQELYDALDGVNYDQSNYKPDTEVALRIAWKMLEQATLCHEFINNQVEQQETMVLSSSAAEDKSAGRG